MATKKSQLDIANELIAVGMDIHEISVRKKLVEVQRKMLKEGMHNGSHGIAVDNIVKEKRAKSQAESCKQELSALIEMTLGRLEEEEDNDSLIFEKTKKNIRALLDDLEYEYLIKYNTSGRKGQITTWACILMAFFIILADITLALQLVQKGFVFPEPADKNLKIQNLMTSNFFEVLRANWQVFFITVGVAIFTIILKICFDKFIGTPYGDALVKKMRFTSWFSNKDDFNNNENLEHKLKVIRRYERIKNGTILGLTTVVIIFLFLLAHFRSFSMEIERLEKELNSELIILKANGTSSRELMDYQKEKQKEIANINTNAKSNREVIFFGITLLFPIVSAVCLSIAGTAIENERKILLLKKEIKNGKINLEEVEEKYGKIKGEHSAWKLEKEYIKSNDWVILFSGKLQDIYDYGFTIGNIRPDLFQNIPDMIVTIEKFRDKRILFKTNYELTKFYNNGN